MILDKSDCCNNWSNSQMSNWFYEKSELRGTPSFVDGISFEIEQRYRREGSRFIIRVGSNMKLRYDTMATGVVYFHRFYMYHSFKSFPRFVTASCCLFLAGKVEETPKKCKDIIKTARTFLTDHQFATFGEDPKEEVLTLERIVLQTIRFDLQVDHPYEYLLKYAKSLKGDKDKLQTMVQMAWTFINDSLCTTICLQWEPEIIAIALMFLAGKLSKFEVTDWEGRLPKHKNWWDMFVEDINIELLEDICHQVLDLYSTPLPDTPKDSPPNSPTQTNSSQNSGIPTTPNSLPTVMTTPVTPHTQQGVIAPPHPPQPPLTTNAVNSTQIYGQNLSQPYRYAAPPQVITVPPPPPPPVPPTPPSWDPNYQQFYQNYKAFGGYAGAPQMPSQVPLPPQHVSSIPTVMNSAPPLPPHVNPGMHINVIPPQNQIPSHFANQRKKQK